MFKGAKMQEVCGGATWVFKIIRIKQILSEVCKSMKGKLKLPPHE